MAKLPGMNVSMIRNKAHACIDAVRHAWPVTCDAVLSDNLRPHETHSAILSKRSACIMYVKCSEVLEILQSMSLSSDP